VKRLKNPLFDNRFSVTSGNGYYRKGKPFPVSGSQSLERIQSVVCVEETGPRKIGLPDRFGNHKTVNPVFIEIGQKGMSIMSYPYQGKKEGVGGVCQHPTVGGQVTNPHRSVARKSTSGKFCYLLNRIHLAIITNFAKLRFYPDSLFPSLLYF